MKTHTIIGPPEIVAFVPNRGAQRDFLSSRKKERWFFAGNRSGKTFVGTRDIGLDMTGLHRWRPRFSWPWDADAEFAEREKRSPMVWWACSEDLKTWMNTIHKYFDKMLRPLNVNWATMKEMFEFHVRTKGPSGRIYEWDCEIHAKKYESGREKFQSAGLAGVWFDEEPTYSIYEEATMRVATDWSLWVSGTMTPVKGMTWVFDRIYEPHMLREGNEWIEVFEGDTFDNASHLPAEEMEILDKRFPEGSQEREVRLHGRFLRRTGLIWPTFDPDIHVVDDFDPTLDGGGTWTFYRGIDLGWNNPTACLWGVVNREGELFIYREYYEAGRNLAEHATEIRTRSGNESYRYTIVDPAARQVDPVSGTSLIDILIQYGVPCLPGDNDVAKGLAVVAEWFRVNEDTKRAKVYVCRSCRNLIKEIRSYRYKEQSSRSRDTQNAPEKPQKKDDHAVDALRYLIMSNPRHWVAPRPVEVASHAEWTDTGY